MGYGAARRDVQEGIADLAGVACVVRVYKEPYRTEEGMHRVVDAEVAPTGHWVWLHWQR